MRNSRSKSVQFSLILVIVSLILGFSTAGWKKQEKSAPKSSSAQAVYFSPNGQIRNRIVNEITDAKESIDIAVFNITSFGIRTALNKAKKNGVQIRIVTDQGQSEDIHSVVGSLLEDGFKVKLIKGKGRNGLMHNKFAIFDHKLLLTGSYNWTETAEHYNYENTVFLSDKNLLQKYQKEFDSLWSKS